MTRRQLAALALAAIAGAAAAHKASDAYVTLRVDGAEVSARLDVALRDLDRDLDLDADADDRLTWREVRTRWSDIVELTRAGLVPIADGAACIPANDGEAAPALAMHSDGRYAVVRLSWRCASAVQRLDADYRLFARSDPTHRGIVRYARGDDPLRLAVLSPGARAARLHLPASPPAATVAVADASATVPAATQPVLASPPSRVPAQATDTDTSSGLPAFGGFVREGIHHILIGYDHILFLLSLLLPAVWQRRSEADAATGRRRTRWAPATDGRRALVGVLKVVTAFTLAHSITLALSVFDVLDPPSRWVESTIAASVVLAALNNVWPLIAEARWKLTFVFGLVHGFGFAAALKDAGLAHGDLVSPLLGFNLGVEIGQLCIVGLVLPPAWSLRATRTYRGAFAGGSLTIAGIAALWLVQRAFDLSLIAG
jgi:hypothetical protein